MRRPWIGLFLCVALLLAGCTRSATPAEANGTTDSSEIPTAPPAHAPTPEFSDETGAIQGVVTDDNLMPLSGALVGLGADAKAASLTDANGKFTFSKLQPGRTVVSAAKLGYESTAKAVQVEPGKASNIALSLSALPTNESYHLTQEKAGYICLGGNVGTGTGQNVEPVTNQSWTGELTILGCALTQNTLGPPVSTDWTPKLQNSTDFLVETTWRATQGFGNGLIVKFVWLRAGPQNESHPATFRAMDARGSSPTRIHIDSTIFGLDKNGQINCPGECLQTRHLPYATQGVGSTVTFNLMLQQPLDEFLTVFYGDPMPDQFTVLP